MDRFRTALQLHKDLQGHPGTKPPSAKAAGSQEWPPPIVYTSTRSLNIPLAVLRQRRVMAAHDRGPFVDAFKI
ncbi:MAG: exopolysaccharide biosynthesis protein, partial [Nitrospirota bacterium]